jgi:hypothetical protein
VSDATLFQIKPYRWRFTETPYNFPSKKSGSEILTFRSRWCYCAKTIMASAQVLVFLLFVFHLPAARGPGLDRPGQARHLAAAAAAAGAVVAEAADH